MGSALLLAALLHVLLVLVIGNSPGGSAKPGEGAWGQLNVRLQGNRFEAGSGEPATIVPERGPVGQAERPRFGGAVRDQPPPPEQRDTPGAARRGQFRAQPGEQLTGEADTPQKATPAAQAPAPSPAPSPSQDFPPPPPAPSQLTLPSEMAAPAPARLAPAREAVRRQAPAAQDQPLQAPTSTLQLPEPPAPTPAPLTMPSEMASPAPSRIAPSREPVARPAAPSRDQPLLAPSTSLQLPEPPAPVLTESATPNVRRLDREPIERARAAPPVTPDLSAPPDLPPLSSAPAATTAPSPATTPTPSPSTATTTTTARPTPTPTPTPRNSVSLDGSTTPTTTQPSVGAPDAGSQVGHDVATPASTPPNAPKLNLDLRPSRGPALPRGNAYGVIQAVPKPPDAPDKLAEEIKRAGQQDCRKAYADKGLVAMAPIVRDALREKGCRW